MLLKGAMEVILVHCIPSELFHTFPLWVVPANQYEPDHLIVFITSVFNPVPLAFDHPDNGLVVYLMGLPVIASPTATHIEPLYAISFAFKLIGLDVYEDSLELVYIVLFVTKIWCMGGSDAFRIRIPPPFIASGYFPPVCVCIPSEDIVSPPPIVRF